MSVAMKNNSLYKQIHDNILADFIPAMTSDDNETALPTIKKLSEKYKVSEITVRTALRKLKESGRIRSRRGGRIYLNADAEPLSTSWSNLDKAHVPFSSPNSVKIIKVALIDSLPFHVAMWKELVTVFSKENPLLKVELKHGVAEDERVISEADIVQFGNDEVFSAATFEEYCELPGDLISDMKYPAEFFSLFKDGRCHGIPLYVTFPYVAVNTSLLAKAGLSRPDIDSLSWDAYVELIGKVSTALRVKNFFGAINCAGSIHRSFTHLIGKSMACLKRSDGKFNWGHETVLEFFKEFSSIGQRNFGIMPDSFFQSNGGIVKNFYENKLVIAGVNSVTVNHCYGSNTPNDVKITQFPLGDSGKAIWSANYLMIRDGSPLAEESLRLLKFLCGENASMIMAKYGTCHFLNSLGYYDSHYDRLELDRKLMKRSVPITMFTKPVNYKFIFNYFGRFANQVRDGLISPTECVRLLTENYLKCQNNNRGVK